MLSKFNNTPAKMTQINSPNSNQPKTIKSSIAAATSMTFGIMSPLVLCSCLPSIVTSICAIVLGHIALVKIKRSDGELVGRKRAIAGLALGYPFLIISLCLSPMYFSRIDNFRNAVERSKNQQANGSASVGAFANAERKIAFSGKVAASGNNRAAVGMAGEFSQFMGTLRDTLIEREDGDNHQGKFLTFCQSRDGSVCFLVFVPEYRRYEDEAKDTIASAAWLAATNTVKANGYDEDCEIAVGLKGNFTYGSVMIGRAGREDPDSKSKDKNRLERFFIER